MKYAVIQTGGKQYRVQEGDVILVERLVGKPLKAEVTFSEVLLVADNGVVQLGTPHLSGFTVKGFLEAEVKGPKIRVSRFKAKARERKVTGHRQSLSQVLIQTIGASSAKMTKETVKKETKIEEKPKSRATKKTTS